MVITMGCGDTCPIFPGKRYEDWELDRPGRPARSTRSARSATRSSSACRVCSQKSCPRPSERGPSHPLRAALRVARFGGQIRVLQTTYRTFFLARLRNCHTPELQPLPHGIASVLHRPDLPERRTEAEGRIVNHPNGISVDPDMAAQRANALLESEIKASIGSVRELAQRLNALDAAILEYEVAWHAATQAGWTEDKLRDIGLHSPESSPALAGRRSTGSPAGPLLPRCRPAPRRHRAHLRPLSRSPLLPPRRRRRSRRSCSSPPSPHSRRPRSPR